MFFHNPQSFGLLKSSIVIRQLYHNTLGRNSATIKKVKPPSVGSSVVALPLWSVELIGKTFFISAAKLGFKPLNIYHFQNSYLAKLCNPGRVIDSHSSMTITKSL